jgi:hypothetical protein
VTKFVVVLQGGYFDLGLSFDRFPADHPYGFYTTRYVEADDADAAVARAFALVHEEVRAQQLRPSDSVAPFLRVDEIFEVEAFADDITPPGAGFGFYPYDPD